MTAAPAGGGRIERLLRMARQQLDMEVSYVSRFDDGRQVFSAVQGDASSFGLALGAGPAVQDSYCVRMLEGSLPNALPDAAVDARVRDLPTTRAARIGAYIGVPLHLPDGTLYGTFCCLSHERRPQLGQRDVAVLQLLGELLADELQEDARRLQDRAAVEETLSSRGVQIALQPILDLTGGGCCGLEALARFRDGTPDEMFARAENAGLRRELELLCLRQALELVPALGPGQRLAINLSPEVACFVAEHRLLAAPPHRLVLEITEHAEVSAYQVLRDELAPLRREGLQIAVDDAGAGFASLRHILELRPDIIKIDRSLVAGVDGDAARRAAVTTFVLLALEIGATVTAEGVERAAELDALRALGVDAAQGFLLARPSVAAADREAWTAPGTALLWEETGSRPDAR